MQARSHRVYATTMWRLCILLQTASLRQSVCCCNRNDFWAWLGGGSWSRDLDTNHLDRYPFTTIMDFTSLLFNHLSHVWFNIIYIWFDWGSLGLESFKPTLQFSSRLTPTWTRVLLATQAFSERAIIPVTLKNLDRIRQEFRYYRAERAATQKFYPYFYLCRPL